MKFNNKNTVSKSVVKLLSSTAFDIYIIHCHILIFDYVIKDGFLWILDYSVVLLPILVFISVVCIYMLLSIIGFVRQKLFDILRVDKMIHLLSDRFTIFD